MPLSPLWSRGPARLRRRGGRHKTADTSPAAVTRGGRTCPNGQSLRTTLPARGKFPDRGRPERAASPGQRRTGCEGSGRAAAAPPRQVVLLRLAPFQGIEDVGSGLGAVLRLQGPLAADDVADLEGVDRLEQADAVDHVE